MLHCVLPFPVTTISLKLPDRLAADLHRAADEQRRSRSALIREALAEKLAARRPRKRASIFDLSRDLCGAGKSGLRDLSSNPKHLEGYGV